MIFRLKEEKDKVLESMNKKAMKELDEFFKINWVFNRPRIILIKTRKEINKLQDRKTEDWLVGWAEGRSIFLLDRKRYEKESCHKYSKKEYYSLLKHELCHQFIEAVASISIPTWLNEGVCVYLSGQNKFKNIPRKFNKFLEFYSKGGKEIYNESGFVVELLLKEFGREKLMKLIKSPSTKSKKEFNQLFKKIYGFNLNYFEINKLWGKNEK